MDRPRRPVNFTLLPSEPDIVLVIINGHTPLILFDF